MPYGLINADSIVTSVSGGVLGGGNASIMKNRIINGAMVIDQRNAGASVTGNNGVFLTDRFRVVATQTSKLTGQQNAGSVTPPTGFTNYLGITSSSAYSVAAGDVFAITQPVEGFNIADLGWGTANAKTVTLSAWVYSSLTGTFGGSLQNGATNRAYPFSYSIPVANTWTQISITIVGDTTGTWATNNTQGILVSFALGAGSTFSGTAGAWAGANQYSVTGATSVVGTNGATFYITGVQLEVGSFATGYEYVNYQTSLANCQRYYYKATTGTLFNQLAFCNVRTTTSHYAFMQLPVTMRANPTSVDYSTIGVIASWGAGVVGLNSLTFANAAYGAGQTQVLLDAVTSSAVGTVGQVSMLLGANSATGYVAFNAEL